MISAIFARKFTLPPGNVTVFRQGKRIVQILEPVRKFFEYPRVCYEFYMSFITIFMFTSCAKVKI